MLREILTMSLLLVGTLFMVVAGLGLLRMPDLYMRMSASAKANTLGIGLILLAAVVYFPDPGTKGVGLAVIAFMFLSTPIGAHMIGRAAYLVGVPLWDKTVVDELRSYYAPGSQMGPQESAPNAAPPPARLTNERPEGP